MAEKYWRIWQAFWERHYAQFRRIFIRFWIVAFVVHTGIALTRWELIFGPLPEIHSLKELIPIAQKAQKEGDVIVFTVVENVLLRPDTPLLTLKNREAHMKTLLHMVRCISNERSFKTLSTLSFPQVLVEQDAPETVRKLREQGVVFQGIIIYFNYADVPAGQVWWNPEYSKRQVEWWASELARNGIPPPNGGEENVLPVGDPSPFFAGYPGVRSLEMAACVRKKTPFQTIIIVDQDEITIRYLCNILRRYYPNSHIFGLRYMGGMKEEDVVTDVEPFQDLVRKLRCRRTVKTLGQGFAGEELSQQK
ncbi:MAG: hypothetical protein LBJ70_00200 [Holosporales bacterium]|nr:hypothetical protein [Holosporales bacterium]